ncbi:MULTISPECIES: group III truncated hemoglobin [Chryseobacterium]|uniref:Hemoglobin n=1 Tax=Chryseobacterium camelliae TaxID=1265445 RepID=A0ABU0TM35_9FLAO|nr:MULTISPECIES: group III truncated hemoglobin [Chryseobacterium]MDT3408037.1 hemoglobin [Pseudacidovorax intermedius]MDQ1098108.1 hemoglobin [Chryseobacterium camelliae]MDQ1102038.1 hemoglobin [Chryseobacterium sp. SORGH_AS_1048]MDR6085474.1 hemoglobin [Chryseobacterium sp. SORGH_AS_0909]MDR6129838.1 hemoglobin [Chryseobacterium sp. SORGH_AS_1175]
MKKLETRQDIEHLVNSFYDKVVHDETIGFFFNDVAKVNWDNHLPKMYAFWESVLFGQMTYKGNPMGAHFPINEVHAMEKQHFERWLELWISTIEEEFTGENADMAVYKAQNIAKLMAFKMELARRL